MKHLDYRARWLAAEKRWLDYAKEYAEKWKNNPIPQDARRACQREEQLYCDAIRESEKHGNEVFKTECDLVVDKLTADFLSRP